MKPKASFTPFTLQSLSPASRWQRHKKYDHKSNLAGPYKACQPWPKDNKGWHRQSQSLFTPNMAAAAAGRSTSCSNLCEVARRRRPDRLS